MKRVHGVVKRSCLSRVAAKYFSGGGATMSQAADGALFAFSVEELMRAGLETYGWKGYNGPSAPGKRHIANAIRMLESEMSVPFISRYRSAETGGLNAESLESLARAVDLYRELLDKKRSAFRAAGQSDQINSKQLAQIKANLCQALTLEEVEDIHGEFRTRKNSKYDQAVSLGFSKPAEYVWQQKCSATNAILEREIRSALSSGVTFQQGKQAVIDILAHKVAHDAELKREMRQRFWDRAEMCVGLSRTFKGQQKKEDKPGKRTKESQRTRHKYEHYENFVKRPKYVSAASMLAINRGVSEKVLSISFKFDKGESQVMHLLHWFSGKKDTGLCRNILFEAAKSGWSLLKESLARATKRQLTVSAHEEAITIFTQNVRQLLTLPRLSERAVVLGIDPGFKNGCKLAVVSPEGKLLENSVVFLHKAAAAKQELQRLIDTHRVGVLAIGNGHASRQVETFVAQAGLDMGAAGLRYSIVNESGVSIYSTSAAAREEFGDLNPLKIGPVSIARRLQDSLCELVKYDPSTLGVGMYQKDVSQKALKQALDRVVVSCVSLCGVDLNRASPGLLGRVAGLSKSQAKSIKTHQAKHGPFTSLADIISVSGVGKVTFQQCAGFLRVDSKVEPLDNTIVLPEMYPTARRLIKQCGLGSDIAAALKDRKRLVGSLERYKQKLKGDLEEQVFQLLTGPWDLRDAKPAYQLRKGPLSMQDLKLGQQLDGFVENSTSFGTFVDIGVEKSALIHVSQLRAAAIQPQIGQVVSVVVQKVDIGQQRVSLTLPGLAFSEESKSNNKSSGSNQKRSRSSGAESASVKKRKKT